jgi:hypothetical protein
VCRERDALSERLVRRSRAPSLRTPRGSAAERTVRLSLPGLEMPEWTGDAAADAAERSRPAVDDSDTLLTTSPGSPVAAHRVWGAQYNTAAQAAPTAAADIDAISRAVPPPRPAPSVQRPSSAVQQQQSLPPGRPGATRRPASARSEPAAAGLQVAGRPLSVKRFPQRNMGATKT